MQNSKIVANPSPVASLTLQVFITVDSYVQWTFLAITGVLFFYKIYAFSYPMGLFLIEFVLFVALFIAQLIRLFLGSRGNKTESSTITFLFLLLTLGTVFGNFFFVRLQTYVIVIETAIGYVSIAFSAAELIFGIIAAIEFKSLENS